MHARLITTSGLIVDLFSAGLHRGSGQKVDGICEPPVVLQCRVPAAMLANAPSHLEVNLSSVVVGEQELAFFLMRGGGTAAALVFDIVGEFAQTMMHLALARGHLDIAVTDGHAKRLLRFDAADPLREALARSASRRVAGVDEMAVCLRQFLEWLDSDEAREELRLQLDTTAAAPNVVLSLYIEESAQERYVKSVAPQ